MYYKEARFLLQMTKVTSLRDSLKLKRIEMVSVESNQINFQTNFS